MMKTFGIREAKARLTELIATARGGDEVVITARGKPVARLSSLEVLPARRTFDEVLKEMEAEGIVERPTRPLPRLPPLVVPDRAVDLGKLVRELRR